MDDLEQWRSEFDQLCAAAQVALADLEDAANGLKQQQAHFHGVDPSQVELTVFSDNTTEVRIRR
jgi:hypothetical protein